MEIKGDNGEWDEMKDGKQKEKKAKSEDEDRDRQSKREEESTGDGKMPNDVPSSS